MVGLIVIGVRCLERGDTKYLCPHIVGQAASHRRYKQRLLPLRRYIGLTQRQGIRRFQRRLGGFHASLPDELHLWSMTFDVRLYLIQNLVHTLRLYQAHVTLHQGRVWQDGLAAGAAIAAMKTVDGKGRPKGKAVMEG